MEKQKWMSSISEYGRTTPGEVITWKLELRPIGGIDCQILLEVNEKDINDILTTLKKR